MNSARRQRMRSDLIWPVLPRNLFTCCLQHHTQNIRVSPAYACMRVVIDSDICSANRMPVGSGYVHGLMAAAGRKPVRQSSCRQLLLSLHAGSQTCSASSPHEHLQDTDLLQAVLYHHRQQVSSLIGLVYRASCFILIHLQLCWVRCCAQQASVFSLVVLIPTSISSCFQLYAGYPVRHGAQLARCLQLCRAVGINQCLRAC